MSRDSFTVTRPNAKLGGSDPFELVLEEFTGMVEESITTRSVTEGWLPVRTSRALQPSPRTPSANPPCKFWKSVRLRTAPTTSSLTTR